MAQKRSSQRRRASSGGKKQRPSLKVGQDTYFLSDAGKIMVEPADGEPYAPHPADIPPEFHELIASQ